MVLEAVYEQDFHSCSYGFRPGRSAHQALDDLGGTTLRMAGGWILEVDIARFFDTLDHAHLREILSQRVRDGVLLRLIGKWLNAGVMEGWGLSHPDAGTPQGGVISPLLANIYLHTVLDEWFARDVMPRLRGRSHLVRYADDFVILFGQEDDARRIYEVLPKRFSKYGLTLHPDKTRLIPFRRPDLSPEGAPPPGTFDFLGFTIHWGLTRNGRWSVKRKTSKKRFGRSLRRIREWCRRWRHLSLREQQQALGSKLRGHYGYFGVIGNSAALTRFFHEVTKIWRGWLSRRSQKGRVRWDVMRQYLMRFPLPAPRIMRPYQA
jgi:group II intron reverse transcriptase/maturase